MSWQIHPNTRADGSKKVAKARRKFSGRSGERMEVASVCFVVELRPYGKITLGSVRDLR